MTDDLKKRLNTMGATGWNPIGYEALERINQLEKERDQLREQVKMLREVLGKCRIILQHGKLKKDILAQRCVEEAKEALAATEPKP